MSTDIVVNRAAAEPAPQPRQPSAIERCIRGLFGRILVAHQRHVVTDARLREVERRLAALDGGDDDVDATRRALAETRERLTAQGEEPLLTLADNGRIVGHMPRRDDD